MDKQSYLLQKIANKINVANNNDSETKASGSHKTKSTPINILLLIAAIIAIAFFSPRISTININSSVGNNVHVETVRHVRYWSELSKKEKEELKTEARRLFPEIDEIGSGVDWKPITQWLDNKGISVNNTRDLFRN